jgi:hypothetical protein
MAHDRSRTSGRRTLITTLPRRVPGRPRRGRFFVLHVTVPVGALTLAEL